MKILVLGSDGQIGTSLVKFLQKEDHDVVEFDIFSESNNDLRIPNILDSILADIDFVFFLAFDVGGSIYLNKYQNTFEFIDNNIKLMDSTFASLKKYNKKFIFASSQMSNMLHSSYGVLKRIGEMYTGTLNGVVAKFWNVYGYEADLEKSHVITDFIIMARDTGEISMRTDGMEKRQFLYSDDCSECLSILMNRYDDISPDEELNISNFEWSSIRDIADIVAKEFGDCDIHSADLVDLIQLDRGNEPNDYILNFWKPKTSLEDGIRNVLSMYLEVKNK